MEARNWRWKWNGRLYCVNAFNEATFLYCEKETSFNHNRIVASETVNLIYRGDICFIKARRENNFSYAFNS